MNGAVDEQCVKAELFKSAFPNGNLGTRRTWKFGNEALTIDYDYDYEHEHEHEHEGVALKLEPR